MCSTHRIQSFGWQNGERVQDSHWVELPRSWKVNGVTFVCFHFRTGAIIYHEATHNTITLFNVYCRSGIFTPKINTTVVVTVECKQIQCSSNSEKKNVLFISQFVEHFDFADCGQPQMAIGQGHPDALAQYTARFSATHVDIVGCVLNVCVLILVLIYWYLTAKCRSSLTSFCSKCQNLSIIDRRQLQQMCIVFNFKHIAAQRTSNVHQIQFILFFRFMTSTLIRPSAENIVEKWNVGRLPRQQQHRRRRWC